MSSTMRSSYPPSRIINLGTLEDVFESKGITLVPLTTRPLDQDRFELTGSVLRAPDAIQREYTGFEIPLLSIFDNDLVTTLAGSEIPIRKLYLATTEYKKSTPVPEARGLPPGFRTYTISANVDPLLTGCAQYLPMTEEEKFLCRIKGVKFI